MKQTLLLFFLLTLFWVTLSSSVSVESVISGILVSCFVIVNSQELKFSSDELPKFTIKTFFNLFYLLVVLIIEVLKANYYIAKIVLGPNLKIKPQLIKIEVKPKNDFNRFLYANCITLTPGTLTVDINENCFIVHALTDESAKSLKNNNIEKIIMRQDFS